MRAMAQVNGREGTYRFTIRMVPPSPLLIVCEMALIVSISGAEVGRFRMRIGGGVVEAGEGVEEDCIFLSVCAGDRELGVFQIRSPLRRTTNPSELTRSTRASSILRVESAATSLVPLGNQNLHGRRERREGKRARRSFPVVPGRERVTSESVGEIE